MLVYDTVIIKQAQCKAGKTAYNYPFLMEKRDRPSNRHSTKKKL